MQATSQEGWQGECDVFSGQDVRFRRNWPVSRYFSIEISTFSVLFHWNLYFLFTCLLKSLLSLYFSIEIPTYSLLNLRLKPLLSLDFSIEIFTVSLLFWLQSKLSLYFSIETSTSSRGRFVVPGVCLGNVGFSDFANEGGNWHSAIHFQNCITLKKA